jgi:hypothetical protein
VGRIDERFPWAYLVIAVLLVANALLWWIEAMSGNQNAYVAALFIVLCLIGSGFCLSVWRKSRRKNEVGS